MSIINLADSDRENFVVSEVGNKAFNMALIKKCGLRAADGFVIPISAFEETVRDNNAEAQYRDCNGENDFVKLRELIKTFHLPQKILDELRAGMAKTGYPVIVRSSSPLEDGSRTSMAGMYLSVGNVSDEQALLAAIREVWASAFYNKCKEHKPLAVLIQSYHRAEVGGVIFSQNPFGRDAYYGEFSYGGAEKTVNGEENTGFELSEEGIEGQAPRALAEQSKALYRAVAVLRDELGCEVDVEWLIDKQGLMILQVRPITALKRRKRINSFAVIDSEAAELLDETDMSDFYDRYMKWYDKRMRLRTICKKHKVHLPIVKYVFYTEQDLDMAAVFNAFPSVNIFKIESEIGIRTMKKELVEGFLAELYRSLKRERLIVRIQEITETEGCGNSCIMGDGKIFIECMPGGFGGFLTGALDFSRYIVDDKYHVCQKDILEYDTIWKFTDKTNRFEKTVLESPVKGELSETQLREIVDMTVAINREIPNAKLEFEVAGEHAFFNDATLENEDFEVSDVAKRVISAGDFEGELNIMTIDELEDMKKQLGTRSVIAEGAFLMRQKEYLDSKRFHENGGRKVLAAPYPAPCLSVLIPYYDGFIFSRGGALSHLAIILREQKKPAVIDEGIYDRADKAWVAVKSGVVYEGSRTGDRDEKQ